MMRLLSGERLKSLIHYSKSSGYLRHYGHKPYEVTEYFTEVLHKILNEMFSSFRDTMHHFPKNTKSGDLCRCEYFNFPNNGFIFLCENHLR